MIKSLKNLFSATENETPSITTDIHSHLIPGIDDGSQNMEDSISMIEAFVAQGYTKLITTPHIMSHRYPNSRAIILEGLSGLNRELEDRSIKIEVEAASEYYLDETVMELVEQREIMTFGDNYMLFEMSYVQPLHHLEEMLFEIKVAGYRPVLAHPERYLYMHEDFSKYERLKEKGVMFQVNIPSLGGYYSKAVQKIAKKIADAGMVDLLGSDAHKIKHLDALAKVRASKEYAKVFAKNTILNNTL
ncbi:MAG: capsular biosynthesis protein [Helicobacteraceae bacterium]|jgi:protein-tyrosine phosphatase|nr:capsular biosynthesis protein [Helicobacteraceae bacterium]